MLIPNIDQAPKTLDPTLPMIQLDSTFCQTPPAWWTGRRPHLSNLTPPVCNACFSKSKPWTWPNLLKSLDRLDKAPPEPQKTLYNIGCTESAGVMWYKKIQTWKCMLLQVNTLINWVQFPLFPCLHLVYLVGDCTFRLHHGKISQPSE